MRRDDDEWRLWDFRIAELIKELSKVDTDLVDAYDFRHVVDMCRAFNDLTYPAWKMLEEYTARIKEMPKK